MLASACGVFSEHLSQLAGLESVVVEAAQSQSLDCCRQKAVHIPAPVCMKQVLCLSVYSAGRGTQGPGAIRGSCGRESPELQWASTADAMGHRAVAYWLSPHAFCRAIQFLRLQRLPWGAPARPGFCPPCTTGQRVQAQKLGGSSRQGQECTMARAI